MNIGMVAGEASGSILGAGLIHALRDKQPDIQFSGIGGADMIAAGLHNFFDIERLTVMGFIEPLRRLPDLFRIRNHLYRYYTQHKPDVFVGIDYPGFNLNIELKLRKAGIPIVHYVSPSVWAWKQKRIFKIAKATDLVLTLLPFENEIYDRYQVPVTFVGHPLADAIPLQPDKAAARQSLNLEPDTQYVALLPGSRRGELQLLSEPFIAAAELCWQRKKNIKFITSAANALRNKEFQAHVQRLLPNLPIQFFEGRSHDVMAAADVVLLASGTATLETLLFKRPMVIAYRLPNITYQIARRLVKIPYVGMPNLLTQKQTVPEFIQDDATPKNLSNALLDFLDHPEKTQRLQETFLQIHQQLRCNANQRAAEAVLRVIQQRK